MYCNLNFTVENGNRGLKQMSEENLEVNFKIQLLIFGFKFFIESR